MSYTTNINLIRNGLTKNWKQQDFPQKKMYYGYKSIFVIKLYFWLRLFLIYNKINLIQFSVNLLEDNIKSISIVINRSFFKNRGRKRHWLFPSFSKLNHAAILILYANLPVKLKSIKKFNRNRWNIENKIRVLSNLYRQHKFRNFRLEFLKWYIAFIKKKNLILFNNMTIFSKLILEKNQFLKVYTGKKINKINIITRCKKIGFKNFKSIHIKNIIAKKNKRIKKLLKKLKRQNKQKNVYLKRNILINNIKKKNILEIIWKEISREKKINWLKIIFFLKKKNIKKYFGWIVLVHE